MHQDWELRTIHNNLLQMNGMKSMVQVIYCSVVNCKALDIEMNRKWWIWPLVRSVISLPIVILLNRNSFYRRNIIPLYFNQFIDIYNLHTAMQQWTSIQPTTYSWNGIRVSFVIICIWKSHSIEFWTWQTDSKGYFISEVISSQDDICYQPSILYHFQSYFSPRTPLVNKSKTSELRLKGKFLFAPMEVVFMRKFSHSIHLKCVCL